MDISFNAYRALVFGFALSVSGLPTTGTAYAADLFQYSTGGQSSDARQRPAGLPVAGVHAIKLDAGIRTAAPGDTMDLVLPNGKRHEVVHDRTFRHGNGDTTWIGYLKERGNDFRVLITSGSTTSVGRISTPEGQFKLETTANGGVWLIDHTASGGRGLLAAHNDALVPPDISRSFAESRADSRDASQDAASSVIDVLVLYSAAFSTQQGGDGAAITRINHLVAVGNQAYVDSGVAIVLRVVATQKIDYPDSTPIQQTLFDLSGHDTKGVTPVAPAFAAVANLQNSTGADLVTLVRTFNGDTPVSDAKINMCGLSWIGGFGQTPVGQWAEYAYSVVDDGRFDIDATSYRYCYETTLVHELAHNMGSMHDRAQVLAGNGGKIQYGAYPYSFGYGINGVFGTIMSYINPIVGKFSNPNLATCLGRVCGTSESDANNSANNALSLNTTRQAVANFRATVVPLLTAPVTGLWWNPDESGWGVSLTQRGNTIFVAWYTYDASGNPTWYVASNCALTGNTCGGDLYKVTGGSPPTAPWNGANKLVTKIGTINFAFRDSNNASMTYTINGTSGLKTITMQLF